MVAAGDVGEDVAVAVEGVGGDLPSSDFGATSAWRVKMLLSKLLKLVVTPVLMQTMTVAHEDDLADHSSFPERLLRASCFGKRKSLCNERLDPLLLQEVEQGDQILPKQSRFEPFERLDAIGNDPFAAGKKPAAGDVQRVDGDSMKAITTACAIRT